LVDGAYVVHDGVAVGHVENMHLPSAEEASAEMLVEEAEE
jgi:hypothetical protein